MRTGMVEANLLNLLDCFALPFIYDLIEAKMNGAEKEEIKDPNVDFHTQQFHQLTAQLEEEMKVSSLPEMPAGKEQLNDLLIRLRMKN